MSGKQGVNGRGLCEGECMGHSPGNEPQTLMRCHSCGLLQLYETCGWKSEGFILGRDVRIKS